MKKFTLLFVLFLVSSSSLLAQYRIHINNPSFELDNAKIGVITQGWFNCAEGLTSPPDLHSHETSFFSVRDRAAHGNNYISMIARSNNTWEAIGQRLVKQLDKFHIHHIAFRAKHSRSMRVYNVYNHNSERYNQPLRIRMWAGNTPGSKKEFLGATQALDFKDWTKVSILFRPSRRYRYICFDAAYVSEDGAPYNGNVLLDRFSPISIVPDTVRYKPVCIDEKVLSVIDEKLVTTKELEHLATNYIKMHWEKNVSDAELPNHLLNIAYLNTFRSRRKIGGNRKFFYTEKLERLKKVVEVLKAMGGETEASVMETFIEDPANTKDDHLSKKAARKLAKQFSKIEQTETLLLKYIVDHRGSILNEFVHCEMPGNIRM